MNFSSEKENQSQWVLVVFEFLYFSLHLSNRFAFGNLTEPQIDILHEKLGERIVPAVIESLFGHWPENLKEGIRSEFYEKLNDSELEYGSCKKIIPEPGKPMDPETVVTKFCWNICELTGNPKDPSTYILVQAIAVATITNLDLMRLLNKTKAFL